MRRILVESSYAAIWRELLDGISLYIRKRHVPWVLHCVTTPEFLAGLLQRPDGALCVIGADQQNLLRRITRSGVPTVNVLRDVTPALPSVLSDHHLIGQTAAEYFLDRGFRHFAFIGPQRDWSRAREEGFRQRLLAAGLQPGPPFFAIDVDALRVPYSRQADQSMKKWLMTLPRPIAVLAAADFVSRALLDVSRRLRRRVPQDIAILGVDNDPVICEFGPVPLSSIPQDLRRIGYLGAQELHRLMLAKRQSTGPILVPPRPLIARRSTDAYAFADDRVSAAMRLIHSRPIADLNVKQLARDVGISRQFLDRRFKLLVGHTPSREILARRLHAARLMLDETTLTIRQIAARTGFSQAENLTRFFRTSQGLSPSQYRARRLP